MTPEAMKKALSIDYAADYVGGGWGQVHGDSRQFSPQSFQKGRRVKKEVTDPIRICCAAGVGYGALDFKQSRDILHGQRMV